MTNSFYYVYTHEDPDTGEVMYVGMGQKSRAWVITNSNGDNPAYGNRSREHYEWFLRKESMGYTMKDLVVIKASNLSKGMALGNEKSLIEMFDPPFNKKQGLALLKMTEDKYNTALEMRDDGLSYERIGKELELSTMTVYRALNKQTKNIGDDYGR